MTKSLPTNKVSSWGIKILKSKNNDCRNIYIGVMPSDIDQNKKSNRTYYGWYYDCFTSSLISGPPHNYGWDNKNKKYGPVKKDGEYLKEGSTIRVKMDPIEHKLSFILDNIDCGTAYEGIPSDRPLVPCVILGSKDDSVEALFNHENEDLIERYIEIPDGLTEEESDWGSISISWFPVIDANSYQVEVDGREQLYTTETCSFKKEGFFPETNHSFRVRTAYKDEFSDWSEPLNTRTIAAPDFSFCVWKKASESLAQERNYYINPGNFKIATRTGPGGWTPLVGTVPIPSNTVTQWTINLARTDKKVISSYIGVVSSDIDVTVENSYQPGWYYCNYHSLLYSGLPHNYNGELYGPKTFDKNLSQNGQVGVIMDTQKSNLSFIINGVNYGVAYEGIPLDKPLIPCVVLYFEGDSVEFSHFKIKEVVNGNASQLRIYKQDSSYNSLTVEWMDSKPNLFYQAEINGTVLQPVKCSNFTFNNLQPSTEYAIRVRVTYPNNVGKWSNKLHLTTDEEPTPEFTWKECPDYVIENKKYALDTRNTNIATCLNSDCLHVLVGDAVIPDNSLTSWRIRVLKSKNDNCKSIYAGIAPYDIDQNNNLENGMPGWFINCFNSTLWSCYPHNFNKEPYGPRINPGENKYIFQAGDAIDITLNTYKGEMSFDIKGTSYGVAYDGIPLDKPLVPSTIFFYEGDSVELTLLDSKPIQEYEVSE